MPHLSIPHLLGIRMNFHPLPHQGGASGQQLPAADYFNHAHPAMSLDGLIGEITEVGDVECLTFLAASIIRVSFSTSRGILLIVICTISILVPLRSYCKDFWEPLHGAGKRALSGFSQAAQGSVFHNHADVFHRCQILCCVGFARDFFQHSFHLRVAFPARSTLAAAFMREKDLPGDAQEVQHRGALIDH